MRSVNLADYTILNWYQSYLRHTLNLQLNSNLKLHVFLLILHSLFKSHSSNTYTFSRNAVSSGTKNSATIKEQDIGIYVIVNFVP